MKDISSLVKLQWIKNPDEHQERDYYDLPFAEKVTWKNNLEPNLNNMNMWKEKIWIYVILEIFLGLYKWLIQQKSQL